VKLVSGMPAAYDVSELPFPAGAVAAHWYQYGGYYVVHYSGLDLNQTGPLCPGNSIQAGTFQNVTNSPTATGSCDGGTPVTLATPPMGAYLCGTELVYHTAIPTTKTGNLWGTIDVIDGDTLVELTSMVVSNIAITPELDISSCSLLPSAEPTPTVEPTATTEPPPTATVEPTATAEPTAEPSATVEPTATAEPTAEPTATVEPTPMTAPTATAVPTEPPPTAAPTELPMPPDAGSGTQGGSAGSPPLVLILGVALTLLALAAGGAGLALPRLRRRH